MNNKGFTLVEVLVTISLLSIIMIGVIANIGDTFSLSSSKSYEILKKSIITVSEEYIYECDNGLINCQNDYEWQEIGEVKQTKFNLGVMKKYGYFNEEDYINPMTNEEISDCLIINAIKDKYYTVEITLDDSTCKK